jgi:hypothetical protein
MDAVILATAEQTSIDWLDIGASEPASASNHGVGMYSYKKYKGRTYAPIA